MRSVGVGLSAICISVAAAFAVASFLGIESAAAAGAHKGSQGVGVTIPIRVESNLNGAWAAVQSRPANGPAGPQDIARISNYLRAVVPETLRENFELFIYVSKADEGPWAQHMYVFTKPRDGDESKWILLESWPVSTGREETERAKNGERVSTATPAGYYELDPERFFVQYRSAQWQREMPNSMFFDWVSRGVPTGLAIHGVTDSDQVAALGRRASAGCVQLPLDASQRLFDLVRDNFEGDVPRFAYDEKTRTISNKGELARDKNGEMVMAQGYRALVIVDEYGGPEERTTGLAVDSSGSAG